MARRINSVGPKTAKLMIIGDAPTLAEVKFGHPFAGDGGEMLNLMLQKVGISRQECYLSTVMKTRVVKMVNGREVDDVSVLFAKAKKDISPSHKLVNGKWVKGELAEALEEIKQEIEAVRPNVILACGNVAMWALTGRWGVADWRGSLEENLISPYGKVIPTIHPAAITKQLDWRWIVLKDFERAKREMETNEFPKLAENFKLAPDFDTVHEFLVKAIDSCEYSPVKFSFDIENPGGYIDTIGFAWTPHDAIVIPFWNKDHMRPYWNLEEEADIMFLLYKLMTHKNFYGICQNGVHELQYIDWQWFFTANVQRDTMIDHHALVPTGKMGDGESDKKTSHNQANKKNLGFLSSVYRADHRYWKNELDEYETQLDYWRYNARDCVGTFEIHEAQQRKIDSIPKQRFVSDFKNSLLPVMYSVTQRGIRVDLEGREEARQQLLQAIRERTEWIREVVGYDLNLSSSAQMKAFFYDDLQQEPVKVRKGMEWKVSVADEALERIGQNEPLLGPLVKTIQEIRSLNVYLRTFIDGAKLTDEGRMQCVYDITGTKTDRFAHKKTAFGLGTNLGNIPKWRKPKEGELMMPNLRSIFIPDEGMIIADADLNSADAHIVAWESNCKGLKEIFKEGKKIYVELAREFYRDPTIDSSHWSYKIFKGVAHGTHYLGSAAEIARQTGLTVHELNKLQKWYFGRCPEIQEWHKKTRAQVMSRGWIENVFGRRFYYMGERNDKKVKEALAWICQSAVAWIIDIGIVRIHRDLPQVQILNQVHDSAVMQFPAAEAEYWKGEVLKRMHVELPYIGDPLTIPADMGMSLNNWGEC